MHVPKTAGIALINALTSALRPRNVVSGFDRVLFGGFEGFDTIEPALRRSIYLDATSLPANADFISGHLSLATLMHHYETAQRITVLREPISRLLSHWLFWRTETDARLRRWGDWGALVARHRGPLRDLLSAREIACQTDNLSVRMLLWPHPFIPDADFIDPRDDEALIEEAIGQLKRFAYVDIVENSKFAADLEKWLGCTVDFRTSNETKNIPAELRTPLHEELNAEAFRLLEVRTRLDLKLWTAVAQRGDCATNVEWLRVQTVIRNTARYAQL